MNRVIHKKSEILPAKAMLGSPKALALIIQRLELSSFFAKLLK
jgi:hypothetical protein